MAQLQLWAKLLRSQLNPPKAQLVDAPEKLTCEQHFASLHSNKVWLLNLPSDAAAAAQMKNK